MSITLNIPTELENRLKAVAQSEGLDIEGYVQMILENTVARMEFPASNAEREVALIYKINQQALTQTEWERYHALKEKRAAEELEPSELTALFELSDRLEQLTTNRLTYLIELGKLKGISLDDTITFLGLQAPSYE